MKILNKHNECLTADAGASTCSAEGNVGFTPDVRLGLLLALSTTVGQTDITRRISGGEVDES
jgi:hypothetical protein